MADEYNRDRSDEGGDDEEEEVDETVCLAHPFAFTNFSNELMQNL